MLLLNKKLFFIIYYMRIQQHFVKIYLIVFFYFSFIHRQTVVFATLVVSGEFFLEYFFLPGNTSERFVFVR